LSGYALSQTDYRTHVIQLGGISTGYWAYFFNPIEQTTHEVVSSFNHTTYVNQTNFVAQMYPANGTVTY